MDYGETSRIVTLFSRDLGRLGVMARGARSGKSKFGSTLEPMSWIQVMVYYKPSRELQSLSESSHMQLFGSVSRSLERIGIGLRTIELTGALMQSGQTNPLVLDLQVETLRLLDSASVGLGNIWPFFAMRLAGLLGFSPGFRRQDVARVPDAGAWLRLDTGAIEHRRPAGSPGVWASRAGIRAFAILARASTEVIMEMPLEPATRSELTQLVEGYVHYHVEDAYPGRSARVISQLTG
jgi:DNA repair protein RecO (recombination protein O)